MKFFRSFLTKSSKIIKLILISLVLFTIFYSKNLFDLLVAKSKRYNNLLLYYAYNNSFFNDILVTDQSKPIKLCNESIIEYLKYAEANSSIKINTEELDSFDLIVKKLRSKNYSLNLGGQNIPPCKSVSSNVAIIIPYRDRLPNLKLFLLNMHPFLIDQYLAYTIYLIEPMPSLTFNRGMLMNIGYKEALKDSNSSIDCFFFHDVDMFAENKKNIYKCDKDFPVHYAVAVSKFGYSTTGYFDYNGYFGGINAFTRNQFEKINGFSNNYFGWGAEDDDLRIRTLKFYSKYTRRPKEINRYFMPTHASQKPNEDRMNILQRSNSKYSSVNSIDEGISTLSYQVKKMEKTLLFTRIFVTHPNSA